MTDSYWFPVPIDDTELMCVQCRMCKTMEELEYHQSSPAACINCSANSQEQFKMSAPTISARKSVMTMAMRLKVAFESSGINYVDISKDFQGWLIFAAASLIANATLGTHGEALMKSVSHMGGIRVDHQAREIFKNGRGRQFGIYRERMTLPTSGEVIQVFRVNRDCGNVAYKDFLEQVAVPDPNKLNEICAHIRMTAEKAGDVIEFWLGALDIAAMARGTVDVFPSHINLADYTTTASNVPSRPSEECQDPPAQ